MGFIDEKGRLFGKFSIVDLAVVLVLVTAVGWFAYAKFGRDLGQEIAAREEPCRYTIVIATIRPTTADALKKGGKVYEFKTGSEIGTIRNVTTEPSEVWSIQNDGSWFKSTPGDRVDAYIEVDATARVGDNIITVNGVETRVGTSLGITTKWAQVNGNILEFELLGGAGQ